MTAAAWSWAAFGVTCFGVALTGNSRRAGWTFAVCNQPFYIAYGAFTGQTGMIATSIVMAGLYARNLWGLSREKAGLPPITVTVWVWWGRFRPVRVPVVAGYTRKLAAVGGHTPARKETIAA